MGAGLNLSHWADGAWADGSWIESAWGDSQPTPPADAERPSGGYKHIPTTHGERRRFTTPVAEVVAEVAAQQASAPAARLDEHQRREHLIRELEIRGLEYEARYWEALERERKALIEQRRRQDDEAVFLLAALS